MAGTINAGVNAKTTKTANTKTPKLVLVDPKLLNETQGTIEAIYTKIVQTSGPLNHGKIPTGQYCDLYITARRISNLSRGESQVALQKEFVRNIQTIFELELSKMNTEGSRFLALALKEYPVLYGTVIGNKKLFIYISLSQTDGLKDLAVSVSNKLHEGFVKAKPNEYKKFCKLFHSTAKAATAISPKRKQTKKGLQQLEDKSYGKDTPAVEAKKPAAGKVIKAQKPSGGARQHDEGAKARTEERLRGVQERRVEIKKPSRINLKGIRFGWDWFKVRGGK